MPCLRAASRTTSETLLKRHKTNKRYKRYSQARWYSQAKVKTREMTKPTSYGPAKKQKTAKGTRGTQQTDSYHELQATKARPTKVTSTKVHSSNEGTSNENIPKEGTLIQRRYPHRQVPPKKVLSSNEGTSNPRTALENARRPA